MISSDTSLSNASTCLTSFIAVAVLVLGGLIGSSAQAQVEQKVAAECASCRPYSVYSADVNGDSETDILSASPEDDRIAWYENDGSESFTERVITTGADYATSVHAADVDGDGDTDVLSASEEDNKIAWYENDGDGNFTTHVISTDAQKARSVYAADVNGDGDTDVLSASMADNKIAWYENDGNGNFTAHTITTDAQKARDVYAADVNGDGTTDVLSASVSDNKIAWYENDGEGNFTSHTISTNAQGARDVHAEDVDGDGDTDVLSASYKDNKIAWYENDGEESFTERVISTNATNARSVYAEDIYGDGHAEVFSASYKDDKVALYEHDGNGGFSAMTINTDADGATSVYAADVNGDGATDVLSASANDGQIAWYENTRSFDGALPTPTGLSAAREDQNVSLNWDGVDGDRGTHYWIYRDTEPITGKPSDLSPIGSVEATTTTYTDDSTEPGEAYYYRVTAVDDSENESDFSSEARVFLYPQSVTASISRSFGSASGSADYRLVALPGKVDRPLSEVIEGQSGAEWQAYWDDGSDENYFRKHDGSETFRFQPGKAFWLTSTEEWSVEEDFETVELHEGSVTAIPLHEGWNIISNPLDKPVPFSALQDAHQDELQALWGFEGSFEEADTMESARHGTAYYFYNDAGLDSLTIPHPQAATQSKAAPKTETSSLLALSARKKSARKKGNDNNASTIHVGLSTKKETYSLVAPPGRFEPVSLRIKSEKPKSDVSSEDRPKRARLLMTERRPVSGEGESFTLRVSAQTEGPVLLSAENLPAVEGREVSLLDPATGQSYDLRSEDAITIEPGGEEKTLQLSIGTKAYVEDAKQSALPDKMTLTSYPNPVRGQGTLEYVLPEAAEVRLEVYDVLGRQVATLESGRKEAGRHRAQLDSDRLSSGVYFGRLQAGGQTLTRKITVVR